MYQGVKLSHNCELANRFILTSELVQKKLGHLFQNY